MSPRQPSSVAYYSFHTTESGIEHTLQHRTASGVISNSKDLPLESGPLDSNGSGVLYQSNSRLKKACCPSKGTTTQAKAKSLGHSICYQ